MTPCNGRQIIKKPFGLVCLAALFLWLAFGCSNDNRDSKTEAESQREKQPVVATVGISTITEADFRSFLSERPISHRGTVTATDVEKRLDALIMEEVLYQEALRLNLDQEPEVKQRIRQMLNQRLVDEQINRQVWDREIAEGELQKYYETHWNEFNRPEQVRLADVFIAVSPDAAGEERAELRKRAETVLSKALEARGKRSGFGNLVRRYSDQHKTYGRGDTGFFDREGMPAGIDGKLAEEAFKLERVGTMGEQLIETTEGFHIIMLIGKRSAVQRPRESVREQLKQRLRRESVVKARKAYIEGLRGKADVQIDHQIMDKVLADLNKDAYAKKAASKAPKNLSQQVSAEPPPAFPNKDD